MKDTMISEIIELCHSIDSKAAKIYSRLSEKADNPALAQYWSRMSVEELGHLEYWERLKRLAAEGAIPQVFDRPSQVRSELQSLEPRTQALLEKSKMSPTIANGFLLAYRLEFYLLHPAFATLFNFMKTATGETTPEDDYESHIEEFIQGLKEYGTESPEMELLGETLHRLWRENRQLLRESNTDSLSGLLNRRGLLNAMAPLIYLAKRKGLRIGLMMIDIDDFKEINDTCGHQVGDRVIREVGRVVAASVRHSDLVGRFGGEEFLVFLSDVREESMAVVAEKIRLAVQDETSKPEWAELCKPVSVSIGCSQGMVEGQPQEVHDRLIKEADDQMYRAKRAGKNRIAVSDQENPR